LVPGNKQWEIESIAEGIFKVVLTTKADMARLKKVKRLQIENSDIVIHFSEWSSKQLDKWGLYDIWIRASGCPETL
jgi:hypothetical protein